MASALECLKRMPCEAMRRVENPRSRGHISPRLPQSSGRQQRLVMRLCSNGLRLPRASSICHATRSVPVVISVTGCSTWMRQFISRKWKSIGIPPCPALLQRLAPYGAALRPLDDPESRLNVEFGIASRADDRSAPTAAFLATARAMGRQDGKAAVRTSLPPASRRESGRNSGHNRFGTARDGRDTGNGNGPSPTRRAPSHGRGGASKPRTAGGSS